MRRLSPSAARGHVLRSGRFRLVFPVSRLPGRMDRVALRTQIKELIIRELNLEGKTPAELDDDAPLFGAGLGLDSLDALQLAMAIEERYQVLLPEGDAVRPIFASVAAIADFVARTKPAAIATG